MPRIKERAISVRQSNRAYRLKRKRAMRIDRVEAEIAFLKNHTGQQLGRDVSANIDTLLTQAEQKLAALKG